MISLRVSLSVTLPLFTGGSSSLEEDEGEFRAGGLEEKDKSGYWMCKIKTEWMEQDVEVETAAGGMDEEDEGEIKAGGSEEKDKSDANAGEMVEDHQTGTEHETKTGEINKNPESNVDKEESDSDDSIVISTPDDDSETDN